MKTEKHIITKKDAQKWANALRSGKFKQSRRQLQNENGFCCLGVACKTFIAAKKQELTRNRKFLFGGTPASQGNAPEWLQNINGDLHERLGDGYSFVLLNDRHGFTFDEIADIIELVYVHRVLDVK